MKKPSFDTLLVYSVWAVSFFVAFVLSYLIVKVVFNTSFERYGMSYFVLTVLSIASILVIWLDYFLGKKILPD